eukprot:TRINITY_DN13288_c0_g1_i1.p1 TRINITY_DN13288_c0_g1~~TRINITY_DN13288_c0_g1_i1.p1  ORF type:complete len:153 (-),score=26.83 TRINITY_DN13288_c0_g1_i1:377-835(-)
MNKEAEQKPQFSAHLLGMKFMQRKKEEELLKQKELEAQRRLSDAHWILDENIHKSASNIVKSEIRIVDSPVVYGRRSYGGFNKEIEKITSGTKKTKKPKTQNDQLWSAVFRHREFVKERKGSENQGKSVYGRNRKQSRKNSGSLTRKRKREQ